MTLVARLPLLLLLTISGALAMLVPAVHALVLDDEDLARAFLYPAILTLVACALVALATAANPAARTPRAQLPALAAAYSVWPLVLALPLREAAPEAGLTAAWWEMVSAVTGTGATLFEASGVAPSVHLWRSLAGWMGGAVTLIAAAGILAPQNLGGYEVLTGAGTGRTVRDAGPFAGTVDPRERVLLVAAAVLPPYAGLTALLAIALILSGDTGFVALCHAMGVLSTSGISPVGGLDASGTAWVGEAAIACGLALSLSRRLVAGRIRGAAAGPVWRDREVVLGLSIVSAATASLFLVHFALAGGAGIGPGSAFDPAAALHALWGIWFSSLSFLTTTGYLSQDWAAAAAWSGTTAPGLMLAGLAMMGGGIATTAGGVKLLRLAALVRHGEREVERLIHPSSVGGSGADVRRLRREGALAAWVFFMLFAVSITATMLLLGLGGLGFEDATIVAVSALTNTGPLAPAAGAGSTVWADLSGFSAFVSAAAMVIGRLETLAVIAMMDPAFWRR